MSSMHLGTTARAAADANRFLGISGRWFSNYIEGDIDEISIFNKALRLQEIRLSFKAGKAGRSWPSAFNAMQGLETAQNKTG